MGRQHERGNALLIIKIRTTCIHNTKQIGKSKCDGWRHRVKKTRRHSLLYSMVTFIVWTPPQSCDTTHIIKSSISVLCSAMMPTPIAHISLGNSLTRSLTGTQQRARLSAIGLYDHVNEHCTLHCFLIGWVAQWQSARPTFVGGRGFEFPGKIYWIFTGKKNLT